MNKQDWLAEYKLEQEGQKQGRARRSRKARLPAGQNMLYGKEGGRTRQAVR
jgi:hypothetical protein